MKYKEWAVGAAMLPAVLLSSCADYGDATREITVSVQVVMPQELTQGSGIAADGVTVALSRGSQQLTAALAADGTATFTGLVPDVYDISCSWELSASEYEACTGHALTGGTSCTVSASQNACLVKDDGQRVSLQANLSVNQDLVISKIYFAGSTYEGTNRAYTAGQYLELYNQSGQELDLRGLYIGLTETDNPQAFTLDNLHAAYADTMLVLKQIFRIPADGDATVGGGRSVLITNSAVDHTGVSPFEHSLLDADFEGKDSRGRIQNNPATPPLQPVFCTYSGMTYVNFMNTGQMGVVIFRTDEDIENGWQPVYAFGKTRGNMFKLLPKRYVIDGVECLANKADNGPDVSSKRIYADIDGGYACINATTGRTGEVVYRKTARTLADGRRVLQDTNNSSSDFQVSTTIKPREYDE